MSEWECSACGFIHDGESAPTACPDCGAPASRFVFFPLLDASDWDDELEHDGAMPYEDYDVKYPG